MAHPSWNESYASGELPWDTGEPEPLLVEFVFDRGCFHVFDETEERVQFAARVAAALVNGGLWLSFIGSTEGGPREMGPP